MINRREFLGLAAGAGAALTLTPELLRAYEQPGLRQAQAVPNLLRDAALIQRAIPSTGEKLPIISFNPRRESDTAGMRDILKTLLDNGGKVIGFPHGSGDEVALAAAGELGIQNKFVWATAVVGPHPRPADDPRPPKADPAAVRAQIEQTLAQFKVPKIDVVMVGAYAASVDPTYLGVMREMKKEGRVRYVGVHHLAFPTGPAFGDLEAVMRDKASEVVDFVGTDYHVGDRRVEQEILPLAQERKIGFMAHFTFDRGRLFKRVAGTPLPEWAAEFDAKTWPQFFLKYVVSHPAVTLARTGTTKAAHMLENIGGGIGRLPDQAMRKRMAAFVDSLPLGR
jgi:aryl-alcohol dehydrogenase-like predicted oxidoreductase